MESIRALGAIWSTGLARPLVCTSGFSLCSEGEFSAPFRPLEPSALVDLLHGSSCASCPYYQVVPESVFELGTCTNSWSHLPTVLSALLFSVLSCYLGESIVWVHFGQSIGVMSSVVARMPATERDSPPAGFLLGPPTELPGVYNGILASSRFLEPRTFFKLTSLPLH